jgi:hypothetical protein
MDRLSDRVGNEAGLFYFSFVCVSSNYIWSRCSKRLGDSLEEGLSSSYPHR